MAVSDRVHVSANFASGMSPPPLYSLNRRLVVPQSLVPSHIDALFLQFSSQYPSCYYLTNIKSRLKLGNACYHSVQKLLSSSLLSKNLKIKIYRTIILPVVCMDVKLGR